MTKQHIRRKMQQFFPVFGHRKDSVLILWLVLLLWPCLSTLNQMTMSTTMAHAEFTATTTEYTALSKSSAVTSRSIKSKILPSSAVRGGTLGGAGGNSGLDTGPSISVNKKTNTENSELGNGIEHTLIAVSSKSYITAPTTSPPHDTLIPPKLSKRAGNLADLNELKQKNQQKIIKDHRNRSRISTQNEKLLTISNNNNINNVRDHLSDSSGHIPYRTTRPLLPHHVGDYGSSGAGTISAGSGSGTDVSVGYRANSYDNEKWRNEYWDRDYINPLGWNSTKVQHIEAECQDDYMKLRVGFNGTFSGLVYSAGYAYDPDCMYINGSGRDYYEFYIQLNRCGTLGKNALQEENRKNPTNFMWNTVTVQYNPLIEEEYDEHFKVTCEYGYDFWKTVTFPFLDVEVATGNPVVFTLSPPECNMEIQNGYGIGGPRVTGPVRVGDPLTLIIYMRSKYDGFDIVVNDCYAHNGATKRIQLIDEYGCPVDDKLISRFRGSWSDTGIFETQVYAYMKTFRFTGSPALYIECDVRMCHGRCPSQPCHWRNLKAITKRDLSNSSSLPAPPLADFPDVTEKPDPIPLSENVNLFQSLRVLQEGESDGDDVYSHSRRLESQAHQTCLKTTILSAMTASFSAMLCILLAALMITCSRLKHRNKQSSIYDTYITHKGQID